MGVSWVNRHGHVMSRWSRWVYVPGTGEETRERHCIDAKCGHAETKWRRKKVKKK